jgi:predicted kinase
MHSKHTVFYDRLPHYFLEFDLFDVQDGYFLSTVARREVLADSPVVSVPVLYEGIAPRRLEDLLAMIRPSLAKSATWRDSLRDTALRQGLDPERVARETEGSDLSEGLYIKVESGRETVDRLKWVRSDFLQTILKSDSHWITRPVVPNQLTPGVDLFAASTATWPNSSETDRRGASYGGFRSTRIGNYEQLLAAVPCPAGDGFDWPALLALVPEITALAEVPQDPVHHAEGDVLTHTRMVCESLLTLPYYQQADEAQRFILFYSALLHDIAKPSCIVIDGRRISSPGHSRRGSVDIRVMLWRAEVPFVLRERICRIVANHQVPFFAIKGNWADESPEFIVRRLSWEVSSIADLAAVAEADMRGRRCDDAQSTLDDIELFREVAREEGCLETPRQFADAHTRLMYCRSGGTMSVDHPFFQKPGSKVIVMSGLPASGKDTWVAAHAKGLPVISFDDAREELGIKHGGNVGAAVHLAVDRAKALLRDKAPFVWNATHLSGQMRQKTLDLLYAYNAEVEIVYLENTEREIMRRNTKRDTTLSNAGIEKMLYRWEVPTPIEAHRVTYHADTVIFPETFLVQSFDCSPA